jgi:phytoene desaturase
VDLPDFLLPVLWQKPDGLLQYWKNIQSPVAEPDNSPVTDLILIWAQAGIGCLMCLNGFLENLEKSVGDYYKLTRLEPSYRIYWDTGYTDIPSDYAALRKLCDELEPGAGKQLDKFLHEAEYKYRVGISKLVFKPGQKYSEFLDMELIKGVFKLDVFTSIKNHINKHFRHPKIRQMMEFPILFLGALPENTPALYSLMNYADIKLGTWYPEGGMYSVVKGMYELAKSLGVSFMFDHNVTEIQVRQNAVNKLVCSNGKQFEADVVIGSADYHFIESQLLAPEFRTYSEKYWSKRLMAPGSLLFYVGLDRRLNNVAHHSLFFDVPFEEHASDIYVTERWPDNPLFYVSISSLSDVTVAPDGGENLVFLIPVAAGLEDDTEELREKYLNIILERFKKHTGQDIRDSIVFCRSYSYTEFVSDYNAFKGNAYGLANTLMQTAILKPSCRSKKLNNLFYAGQLTVPGPGVPPSLISGEVVAGEVIKYFG